MVLQNPIRNIFKYLFYSFVNNCFFMLKNLHEGNNANSNFLNLSTYLEKLYWDSIKNVKCGFYIGRRKYILTNVVFRNRFK